MSNHFRIKTLAAAIGMAAAATLCAAPTSSVATNNVSLHIVRQATKLRTGDKVLGLLDQSKPMNVTVSLKLRNKAQLDAFVANPHHPNLTPAQFRAMYSPTKA
ncbi:protease pro-enzyme activation domain-containing protein, partial [Staphylococcus aureus]